MALFFIGILVGVCVAIHMMQQRYVRRKLSSARFFKNIPPAPKKQTRLRWGRPKFNLPFFLRLTVLLLLLMSLASFHKTLNYGKMKSLGLWIILDTSASMTTTEKRLSRMDIAKNTAIKAIHNTINAYRNLDLNLRLSTYDMEKQDVLFTKNIHQMISAIKRIQARNLGTDLTIVQNIFNILQQSSSNSHNEKITHVLVISDLPVPEWIHHIETPVVIWKDIASSVENVGFSRIHASRNLLTGSIKQTFVEIRSYAEEEKSVQLTVSNPNGKSVLNKIVTIKAKAVWKGAFQSEIPGEYVLNLLPDDSYQLDNQAIINIPQEQIIRADWQIPDHNLLKTVGWIKDEKNPTIRITSQVSQSDTIPTLIVGNDYSLSPKQTTVNFFLESSPILESINFDVAEIAGIIGHTLPDNFYPVMIDNENKVWLSMREKPPAVIIPGLPLQGEDDLSRFSSILFFNAVRWLLKNSEMKPLYTITSPEKPNPYGNHLALHEDEGHTNRMPISLNNLDHIVPLKTIDQKIPRWPIIFTIAMMVFLIERILFSYGKGKWV